MWRHLALFWARPGREHGSLLRQSLPGDSGSARCFCPSRPIGRISGAAGRLARSRRKCSTPARHGRTSRGQTAAEGSKNRGAMESKGPELTLQQIRHLQIMEAVAKEMHDPPLVLKGVSALVFGYQQQR